MMKMNKTGVATVALGLMTAFASCKKNDVHPYTAENTVPTTPVTRPALENDASGVLYADANGAQTLEIQKESNGPITTRLITAAGEKTSIQLYLHNKSSFDQNSILSVSRATIGLADLDSIVVTGVQLDNKSPLIRSYKFAKFAVTDPNSTATAPPTTGEAVAKSNAAKVSAEKAAWVLK